MRSLALILIYSLIYLSTTNGQTNRHFNNFQDSSLNVQWMNGYTIVADKDSASNFFSRTDEQHPYSSGLELTIPENFRKKNFRLSVNGRVRASGLEAKNKLVVSISENDSAVYWNGLQLPDSTGIAGQWSSFKYTSLFPRNLSPSCKFKVFVWNEDGKSITDVDDLEIIFSTDSFPTFLPSLNYTNLTSQMEFFTKRYYSLHRNNPSLDLSFCILSTSKDTLIKFSGLSHTYLLPSGEMSVKSKSEMNSYLQVGHGNEITILMTDSNELCKSKIEIEMQSEKEEIVFRISSEFLKDVQVKRDAWIFDATVPLTEVYRKNTLLDTSDFQKEYWLGKEGVKYGSGKNSLILYHNTGISSVQVNSETNQFVVNLDYDEDHPFQHFPQRDSLMHEKEDLSGSFYKAGDVRTDSFSIHVGKQIDFVPRIMLNPNGFLAAYVFTEHADWTDLPTHRAVYFGSEKITDAKNATGGFVKNKIPVTKSVFYSNPDKVLNSDSRHNSIFKTPIASIKGTPGFLEFLKQLQVEGNEICLHTPDQYTSKTSLVNEACAFMQKNFNTVTWIDHGYNNGPKNNREAFVCDGLNKKSPSYAADAWEKYGVKYFWNSYYEDFATDDSAYFDFYGSPIHPYPGYGDAAPQPLFWRHPTRTGNFISWPTRDLLEMHDPASWSYHFSNERLNDFVHQRAVKFEHCYPGGSIPDRGFWKKNESGELVVEPEFNKFLEKLVVYRDSGLINTTTVRDLLDYWIACENISFEYPDSNKVIITNQNKSDIKGVSFAVRANKIISEKKMNQKFFDGDLIFWFDMKAGESVNVSFERD